jgi:hypothetical protein
MLKSGLIVGIIVQNVLLCRIDIRSMALIYRGSESFIPGKVEFPLRLQWQDA